jgi:hypothetical protein
MSARLRAVLEPCDSLSEVPARIVRLALLAGALAGLSLLASGCGGSPGTHVAQLSTSTTPSAGSTPDHALAYSRCMHSHGVPLWPDPGTTGATNQAPLTLHQLGVTSSQLTTAQQACRSLLPTTPATAAAPHVLAQALRFSHCMRAHGATAFPDPASNGAITIPHAMESSPAYLAALHVCLNKYGAPPPPSSAGKR